MDSRKSQGALLPGKSIFKDMALGIEYRETQQKLTKEQNLSIEMMLLSHDKAPFLQNWAKAGYTSYSFVKLAVLSPCLSTAVLYCSKKDELYPALSSLFRQISLYVSWLIWCHKQLSLMVKKLY